MGPPDDLVPPDGAGRAWVAPEATTADDGGLAPVRPPPPTPAPGGGPGRDPSIRLPVPLRPLSMGDVLDGGTNVLRADPRTVLALAAVFIVPLQLAVAFLNRDALEGFQELVDQTFATSGTTPATDTASTVGAVLAAVGGSITQALVAAGIAVLVVAWYGGVRPALSDVLRAVARRSPALLVAWLAIHLLEVAGFFTFGIGTLAAMTFYLVTAPAIAVEQLGPFAGMGRSSRLASRRFWFLLGFAVLSGLVATTLGQVLGLLPQVLGVVLGPDIGWVALGVGAIITELVVTIVVGASTTLAYLDLRIRQEGMDLAWAADRHLPLSAPSAG